MPSETVGLHWKPMEAMSPLGPTATLSCVLLVLCPVWACQESQLPRDVVQAWVKERLLDALELEEPPTLPGAQGPDREWAWAEPGPPRVPRNSRSAWKDTQRNQHLEVSEIILFPSSDSPCVRSGSPEISHFTYFFQPSLTSQEVVVTSASFWFYAGEGVLPNSSLALYVLTSEPQLILLAEVPTNVSLDGWAMYQMQQEKLSLSSSGGFMLQVRCSTCQCHANEPDKLPFVHIHAGHRGPERVSRRADGATIPWSPSAIDLLQRPSQEIPEYSDCHLEEIDISFDELGWGNWIVHPKVLTFRYCNGNCTAWDRTTAMLGIRQCCAAVPGTMKSVRITTTSDGGYSFKYETLPNVIPEQCTCI